jgi:hypothetical protein
MLNCIPHVISTKPEIHSRIYKCVEEDTSFGIGSLYF